VKQVLSDLERSSIRKDLYKTKKKTVDDPKIKFFKKYCKNKCILDLGCIDHDPLNSNGNYWLHGHLKSVSKVLVGLDYYKKGVDYFLGSEFDIRYGDAQSYDLNQKFDVVSAGDLIEHLPNPGQFLSCARDHLKDDGMLIISTPNPWCWKYIAYFALHRHSNRINPEHICWFCTTTLRLLLSRYKFDIIEIEYCSRRWWEKFIPLPKHLKNTTINLSANMRS
jgi:2-polyprenyl-3-methyl-5-hydroxy-6-metoxy-1,4-benzoquinol methylase